MSTPGPARRAGELGLPALALSTERTPFSGHTPAAASLLAPGGPGEPQRNIFADKEAEPQGSPRSQRVKQELISPNSTSVPTVKTGKLELS